MMDFRESQHSAVTDGQSEFADLIRTSCVESMKAAIPDGGKDGTGMWAKLTPDYNPGCKRVRNVHVRTTCETYTDFVHLPLGYYQ
jgi:hypothetical protein